jgi:hypothetical protein
VHRDVVDADTWWDRFCRFFTGDSPPGVYLRVVNRVYLAGRVLVELTNDESVRGMGSGGAKKDVELPQLKSKEVAVNYADALSALATKVNNDLPGGTIKFAWATSRSVAMSETFDRPLVIGFLGFDFPVLDDGSLGAPVATFDQLEHKRLEPSSGKPLETSVERANLVLVRRQLESMVETEPRARALAARLDKLGALLPSNLPVTFYLEGPAVQTPEGTAPNLTPVEEKGAAITERNFQRLVSYWGQLEQSLKVIKDARALGGVHIGGKNDDPRINELPLTQRDTEREIERLRKEVGDNPVLHEALEYCVQSLKGEG